MGRGDVPKPGTAIAVFQDPSGPGGDPGPVRNWGLLSLDEPTEFSVDLSQSGDRMMPFRALLQLRTRIEERHPAWRFTWGGRSRREP
jgi:hypothetical protein